MFAEQLLRLKYNARAKISLHPGLFLPYARFRFDRGANRVVRPDTELVIDGFQRSANTFAVVAFELAQRRPVATAHHLHAVAQIREAVRLRVPTVVLIREPDACTMSHLIRKPHLTARMILSRWVGFYERLESLRDHVVVADFRDVTTNYGAVIGRVNRTFATAFEEFEHTEANVARCFERIEQLNRERNGALVESTVSRPSAQREDLKRALQEQLAAPAMKQLRDRAQSVYGAWMTPTRTA